MTEVDWVAPSLSILEQPEESDPCYACGADMPAAVLGGKLQNGDAVEVLLCRGCTERLLAGEATKLKRYRLRRIAKTMEAIEAIELLADLDGHEDRLSTWETEFIESIQSQAEAGKTLSEKQAERLTEIHEKACGA